MEPQTELDQLIAEQQADDTHIMRPEYREQVPLTDNIIERLGCEGDEIVSYLPRPPKGSLLMGPQAWHGSTHGYRVQGCRCRPCTTANTEYQRDLRQRRKNGAA